MAKETDFMTNVKPTWCPGCGDYSILAQVHRTFPDLIGIKKEDIIDHFCKVNICSVADFKKYEERAFVQWEQRSKFQWKQDLGIYHPKFGLKELKSQQRLVN